MNLRLAAPNDPVGIDLILAALRGNFVLDWPPKEDEDSPGEEVEESPTDIVRHEETCGLICECHRLAKDDVDVADWASLDHQDWTNSAESDQQVVPERTLWYNTLHGQSTYSYSCLNIIDDIDLSMDTMMDPRTCQLVKNPFLHPHSAEITLQGKSIELPPPYPSHDHDYFKIRDEEEKKSDQEGKKSDQEGKKSDQEGKKNDHQEKKNSIVDKVDGLNEKDDVVVDVWAIDRFMPQALPAANIPERPTPGTKRKFDTIRRTSARTADIKQREQERSFSNAVRAGLKNDKPGRKQIKNTRPKNSVETTPSQSDIEEWCSQPLKPTCSKITKKKTTKGRIDHSESERQRREVLRKNFSDLSDQIPTNFLRGEKASSQISKQKILNGAKAFIGELQSHKGSYKTSYRQNGGLHKDLLKSMLKLHKILKRRK